MRNVDTLSEAQVDVMILGAAAACFTLDDDDEDALTARLIIEMLGGVERLFSATTRLSKLVGIDPESLAAGG